MRRKLTTKEWVERAKSAHGNKYDYSQTEYVNCATKVAIVCRIHGVFMQNPSNHTRGFGCSSCYGNKRRTLQEFIQEAREVHGSKYDYSSAVYQGNHKKVKIKCEAHGFFFQAPAVHLYGHGCPGCTNTATLGKDGVVTLGYTTSSLVEKFIEIHGSTYNYDKVKYKGIRKKVVICCPTHGEFKQEPVSHILGRGCPDCAKIFRVMSCKKTNEKRILPGGKKKCSMCGVIGGAGTFSRAKNRLLDLSSICRKCTRKLSKQYNQAPARSSLFIGRLPKCDCPTDVGGLLYVKCKMCGKLFNPKTTDAYKRGRAVNNLGFGECHFYCSEECKHSCDIFGTISMRKSERHKSAEARSCQVGIRKALIELQCEEVGYNYCDKCGDIIGVDIHHTQQVANLVDINNPAGMMLLCPGCHTELHSMCA